MIAEIISSKNGKGFSGIINYAEKKNEKEIIYDNLVSNDKMYIINYFNSIKPNRKDFQNVFFHNSLSFSSEEKYLFEDMNLMEDIIKDYMEGMGYGKQPYVAYTHLDKEHPHIHIVSTRVDVSTGKKINDSLEKIKSQKLSEMLEEKYNLIKVDRTPKKLKQNREYNEGLQKRVAETLTKEFKGVKMKDIDIVERFNRSDSEIEAKLLSDSIIFLDKDKNGKKIGSIMGSEILELKEIRFERKKRIKDEKDFEYRVKKNIISNINFALKFVKNNEELANFLNKRGINTNVRNDKRGDYGYSFDKDDIKFKLSELGIKIKELQDIFENNKEKNEVRKNIIKVLHKSRNLLEFRLKLKALNISIIKNKGTELVFKLSKNEKEIEIKGSEIKINDSTLSSILALENNFEKNIIKQDLILKSLHESKNLLEFHSKLKKIDISIIKNKEAGFVFKLSRNGKEIEIKGSDIRADDNNLSSSIGLKNIISNKTKRDINFALSFVKNDEELIKYLNKKGVKVIINSTNKVLKYIFKKDGEEIKLHQTGIELKDIENIFEKNIIKQGLIESKNLLEFHSKLKTLDISIIKNKEFGFVFKLSRNGKEIEIKGSEIRVNDNDLSSSIGLKNSISNKTKSDIKSDINFTLSFVKNNEELIKHLNKRDINVIINSTNKGLKYIFKKDGEEIKLHQTGIKLKDIENAFEKNIIKQDLILKSLYESKNLLEFHSKLKTLDISITKNKKSGFVFKLSRNGKEIEIKGSEVRADDNNLSSSIGLKNIISNKTKRDIKNDINFALSFVKNNEELTKYLNKKGVKVIINTTNKGLKYIFKKDGEELKLHQTGIKLKDIENAYKINNKPNEIPNTFLKDIFSGGNTITYSGKKMYDEEEEELEKQRKKKKLRRGI